MAKTRGDELKIGDVIDTWAGKKRLVSFEDYRGPLADLFPEGARIAAFDIGGGMTIPNNELYDATSF